MSIFSLAITVLVGVLFFVLFFHLSNFLLDYFRVKASKNFAFENSIRVIIFIAPAFIVLFVLIPSSFSQDQIVYLDLDYVVVNTKVGKSILKILNV